MVTPYEPPSAAASILEYVEASRRQSEEISKMLERMRQPPLQLQAALRQLDEQRETFRRQMEAASQPVVLPGLEDAMKPPLRIFSPPLSKQMLDEPARLFSVGREMQNLTINIYINETPMDES